MPTNGWISLLVLGLLASVTAAQAPTSATVDADRIAITATLTAGDPNDPFDFSHRANDTAFKARRGGSVRLTVTAKLKNGFHTYPFSKLASGQTSGLSWIRLRLPEGIQALWPGEEKPEPELKKEQGELQLQHHGAFTWSQDLFVGKDAKPGLQPLDLQTYFMVCDDKGCLPVVKLLKLGLEVDSAGPLEPNPDLEKRLAVAMPEVQKKGGWRVESPDTVAKVETPANGDKTKRSPGIAVSREEYVKYMTEYLPEKMNVPENLKLFTQRADTGLWLFILMGMAWGGISLITPCVFPMIPITVSFFLKQSEKAHHKPITMAAVYSGTIVVVLTLAATLFIHFFRWLSIHPITNFVIGGLFIYFALSLLGMYEIELPSGLARFTSAREGQDRLVGTIFMALTFTIISFACVAPFLGGFAGTATSERPWWHVVLGGLAFSVTFAAPFFLLALFPTMLRKLPKSGSWLNTVKVVMGFLEIAAALKFFRAAELLSTARPTFFTFDLVLGMYVALAVLCGLYLLNIYRLPHDSPVESLSVPRLLFALLFITLGLHLIPGLFKFSAEGEQQRPRGTVYAWVESFLLPESRPAGKMGNLEFAIEQAREHRRKTGQPKRIFLDFTGFS